MVILFCQKSERFVYFLSEVDNRLLLKFLRKNAEWKFVDKDIILLIIVIPKSKI